MEFNMLKKIIDKNDPVGLLVIGTPEDEYHPEINSILARLNDGQSEKEIEKIVVEEFNKWFGIETMTKRQDILKKIAKEISLLTTKK